MSAMGTGFANHDGTASDRIIRYYEERAKGGAGLIFTEICRIDGETGLGNFNQLGAYEGYQMKSLRSLTENNHPSFRSASPGAICRKRRPLLFIRTL